MANSTTFFTNDSGAAGGPIDYVKDVFEDVSLKASNNSGLTSNTNTNPLSFYFGNQDSTCFGPKTLFIKSLQLISDRGKWVNGRPTYLVNFHEPFPLVRAYMYGEISAGPDSRDFYLQMNNVGDGIAVTGAIQRVMLLVKPATGSTSSGFQVKVDGSNTTTLSTASQVARADTNSTLSLPLYRNPTAQVSGASDQTVDLHDFRFEVNTATAPQVYGMVVYFQNGSSSIRQYSGTTYVDKNKETTLSPVTISAPTMGSSLGGVATVYKTTGNTYAVSAFSASTVVSIAQGSSGTNLLNVSTGTGSSFMAGYGVVVPQGTSMYIGVVTNVSTDTLTVSPTLPFGISNGIYKAWYANATYAISATYMALKASIDFQNPAIAGFTTLSAILDPNGEYALWGYSLGVSLIGSTFSPQSPAMIFQTNGGFLQVDGYFAAAAIEFNGIGILHATLTVNGLPAWGINQGQTGTVYRTVFSDAGNGWNSFVMSVGTSMGVIGINRIDLFERCPDPGITTGVLASIGVNQAYTERAAQNASLMALGTFKRTYGDQLYLAGAWTRGTTSTVPGGHFYYGTSTNAVMTYQYYGKNCAILGTAGGGTLTIDGVGTGLSFNIMIPVSSEGFHTLQYTSGSGATSIVAGVDFARSYDEMNSLQIINKQSSGVTPLSKYAPQARVDLTTGTGSTNTEVLYGSTIYSNPDYFTVVHSSTFGTYVEIKKNGYYGIKVAARGAAARSLIISKNDISWSNLNTNLNIRTLLAQTSLAVLNNMQEFGCPSEYLVAGDRVRVLSGSTGAISVCALFITLERLSEIP